MIARRLGTGILLAGLALLAGPGPAVSEGRPDAVFRLVLDAGKRDHFLPAPDGLAGREVRLRLDARRAAPKTRVMWTDPLAAGARGLHITVIGARPDQSFVVAVPLAAGRSVIRVQIAGRGRFDLGFFASGPGTATMEYRFTRRAPLAPEPFVLDIPAPQR